MGNTDIADNEDRDTNNTENQNQETGGTENGNQGNGSSENTSGDNGSNGSPIRRTITGGLIGATIGYLASPENGKKLMENLSADKLKSTGSSLGQSVKEKSKQATDSIKNSAGKLFKKEDVSVAGYSNESEENSKNETTLVSSNEKNANSSKQDSSGENNENVNQRLDRLEEMLTQLLEDKEGQEETSSKSNS